MDDEKDVPYRSHRDGVAHACGHDAHTTLVLGAGLALCDLLRDRPGRVRLIFEPAEETLPGGAIDVIDAGGLEGVDAIFGFHCDPKLEAGRIAVRAGALTSACDMFTLDLRGPGGHTARPHLTVDLLDAAGRVLTKVPGMVRERAAADGEALVVFGAVASGDAANVIPSHAVIGGTFRTPERAVWDRAETLLEEAMTDALAGTGAEWVLRHRRGIPPVVNDGAETELFAAVARSVVGESHVVEAERSLGGDSFAWYLLRVPGTYARLGVHDRTRSGPMLDLHSSHFDIDETAIAVGIRVLVEAALAATIESDHV
jgi:amidohydrolase